MSSKAAAAAAAAAAGASEAASTGPAPKRVRVSRACEQCRSRKAKCDGKTPACSPCVTLSQQCTYGAQPRKRGLPPGSVSALERAVKLLQRVLGLLIVSVEGSEHALLELVQRCGKTLFDDGEEGNALSSAWKDGLVPEALELLREKANETEASERSPNEATEARAGSKASGPPAIDLGLAQGRFQEAIRAMSSTADGPRNAALEGDLRRADNLQDRDDEGICSTEMDWVKEESLQEGEREKDNARPKEPPNTVSRLTSNIDTSLTNSTSHSQQNHIQHPAVVTPPLFTSIDTSGENPFSGPIQSLSMSDIPSQTFHPVSYQQPVALESPTRDNFIMPCERDYPQLPENSRLLLDLYFTYTHVWFPILDKYDLIRFFHIASPSSSAKRKAHPLKTEIPSGKRALLYAVLALASIQNDGLSREVSAEDASPHQSPYAPQIPSSPPASALYTVAQQLIFKPGEEYCLEHVQTLLILSLINIMLSHLNASWLLIGHAGRVAVDIGLKSETKPRFNIRTWLGYLVLETFISMRLGRCPQIREEDWAVPALEEDGWEEWDTWKEVPAADPQSKRNIDLDDHDSQGHGDSAHILSVFNQLAQLLRVTGQVASILPPKQPPEHTHKPEHREVEGVLPPQNILHQLQSWCRGLLPHCSFNVLNPKEVELSALVPTAPHISNLHLFYAHAILELYNRCSSYGLNLQSSVSPPTTAAASSTATILEHVRSTRSLAVVPCTFIHFVELVLNSSPDAGNEDIGPFISTETSVSVRIRILRDDLEQHRHRATTGFLLGNGLLKITAETAQKKDILSKHPSPPQQLVEPRPQLMSQPDDSTFGGQLATMSPSIGSDSHHLSRPSFSGPLSIDPVPQVPSNNQHVSALLRVNMQTGQHQEDGSSRDGSISIYNQPGSGNQAASLPLSQPQTTSSSDGFDEETGMLEFLPWTQNNPEFMQNLGYIGGFSPPAFQLGHDQQPVQALQMLQEGAGNEGGGGYGGSEGGPLGGSTRDDTNIMSGRRGLNIIFEQLLEGVLGAGGNIR